MVRITDFPTELLLIIFPHLKVADLVAIRDSRTTADVIECVDSLLFECVSFVYDAELDLDEDMSDILGDYNEEDDDSEDEDIQDEEDDEMIASDDSDGMWTDEEFSSGDMSSVEGSDTTSSIADHSNEEDDPLNGDDDGDSWHGFSDNESQLNDNSEAGPISGSENNSTLTIDNSPVIRMVLNDANQVEFGSGSGEYEVADFGPPTEHEFVDYTAQSIDRLTGTSRPLEEPQEGSDVPLSLDDEQGELSPKYICTSLPFRYLQFSNASGMLRIHARDADLLQQFNYHIREVEVEGMDVMEPYNWHESMRVVQFINSLPRLWKLTIDAVSFGSINAEVRNRVEDLSLFAPAGPMTNLEGLNNLITLEVEGFAIETLINMEKSTKLWKFIAKNSMSSAVRMPGKMESLKSITCNTSEISTIDGTENFENLELLDISESEIEHIYNVKFLTKLRVLDIRATLVSDISSIQFLLNLQSLDISSCEIQALGDLEPLKNLQCLFATGCSIFDVDVDFNKFTNLKMLCLSCNGISSFKNINAIPNLETLILQHNALRKIDYRLNYPKLKLLSIGQNFIKKFNHFDNLESLEELWVGEKMKIEIPEKKLSRKAPKLGGKIYRKDNAYIPSFSFPDLQYDIN
ncbi:hypothetical protein DASC09_032670 [Saccharomycopsis crataegensis]|uniref:F-box domain-containing protein n=1 Tax=Saccharomycopsis crataegensis TaxID=43959 RepID=A0AAV5QMW5_9ASCO|nr:hypothetical protein DASC09_032670 [Saccharomycopsis crataegensis]